jgi:rod shape-determining protein MreD
MVDPIAARIWLYRALFALLVAMLLFLRLLPLDEGAGRWPGPDLILALAMSWGLRRPDYVPPLLTGTLLVCVDLLTGRPPGLMAALVVLALEVLRAQNALWRDLAFLAEWAVISVLMTAVVVLDWAVQALFLVPDVAVGLYLIQLIGTVIAYPAVVALSALLFGVRKVAPGEVDALGHRL